MKENLFVETIKVKDGLFYNLPLHISRMQRTASHIFGTSPHLELVVDLIPEELRQGIVKCRVLYGSSIVSIAFERYHFKVINTLKLVEDNEIEYQFKSAERGVFADLLNRKEDCDDILIAKQHLVTDTSYSNLVFEKHGRLYTPKSYLLNGIKRQKLLKEGIITETQIELDDIPSYTTIYLINAMVDLEDEIKLPASNLMR